MNFFFFRQFIVLLLVSLVFSLLGGIWTYVTATQSDRMSLQRVTNIVRYDYGRDPSKTAILDIVQQSVFYIDKPKLIALQLQFV